MYPGNGLFRSEVGRPVLMSLSSGTCRLFAVVSGPRAESVLIPVGQWCPIWSRVAAPPGSADHGDGAIRVGRGAVECRFLPAGARLRDVGGRSPDFVVIGNGRAVVVEVDGPHHFGATRKADDHTRDRHWGPLRRPHHPHPQRARRRPGVIEGAIPRRPQAQALDTVTGGTFTSCGIPRAAPSGHLGPGSSAATRGSLHHPASGRRCGRSRRPCKAPITARSAVSYPSFMYRRGACSLSVPGK